MGQNVIILGAGFSHDAGVPLMSQFVERMWEVSMRKSHDGKPLSDVDLLIFTKAMDVRREMDGYHGRANFDDRNIEDILSILSFHVLSGSTKAKEQLDSINRAITRTIELTCSLKHPGIPTGQFAIHKSGPPIYQRFWRALFAWVAKGNEWPTLITLNYDLVLERSLLQLLINTIYGAKEEPPVRYLRLKYYFDNVPSEIWELKRCQFETRGLQSKIEFGTVLNKTTLNGSDALTDIEILKLHGSVNFPTEKGFKREDYNVAKALDDPYILPPIFNKLSGHSPNEMWKTALARLSTAQNIVIVGYSLPKTDIYMQYFLKAALGPNLNLNRLIVFDPTLYESGTNAAQMRARYEDCFSTQLRDRITFRPEELTKSVPTTGIGKTSHFVETLESKASALFF